MKVKFLILFIPALFFNCKKSCNQTELTFQQDPEIICNEEGCTGKYTGPEFINKEDIAHQFSNSMSTEVGDALKKLYLEENFSKVNFDAIEMTTNGMGSGTVVYYLSIPFESVTEKCDAFTSFDHVGGWNHTPALVQRKEQLSKALLPNHKLYISDLKTTKEGLQEYWIQWKNKKVQANCR